MSGAPLPEAEGNPIPETIKIRLAPDVVEAGARILSCIQGCEDPLGQRAYYRDVFRELMVELRE